MHKRGENAENFARVRYYRGTARLKSPYFRASRYEKGFKNIYETRAGATITSHCGEDCLGILYINDAK